MHGHSIAKEMERWWAEHGGRHDDPAWQSYINDYGSLLIDKLMEMSEEHTNAGRFGMSKAGGCTRAAALKHLGYESAELSGSTRATFAIGHVLEVKAIATLRACGYAVTGTQVSVTIDPFMQSAMDGVIELGQPTALSVKTVGYKMSGKRYGKGGVTWTRHGFAAIAANGVKAETPGHWAQIQAEMHGSGLRQGLMLYVAKDMVKAMEADPVMQENGSLTFYAEIVPYDAAWCAEKLVPVWRRQWDMVGEGNPGPAMYFAASGEWVQLTQGAAAENKALTGTFDPCSYCDLSEACPSADLSSLLAASIQQKASEVSNVQ